MRGTPAIHVVAQIFLRIIPAYAGNTRSHMCMSCVVRDHPRVCGEHRLDSIEKELATGSSPRMRGTLHVVPIAQDRSGIIPAYAGNTIVGEYFVEDNGDHPRVCGEHSLIASVRSLNEGSSPRMRGTQVNVMPHGRPPGIIPAYAGNTSADAGGGAFLRDHPRVCGEHFQPFQAAHGYLGSSPRMRGTPVSIEAKKAASGIIPAYAGNTPTGHYKA